MINNFYRALAITFGHFLKLFFFTLYGLILYSFLFDTCKWYHAQYLNKYLTACILCFGIILGIG